MDPVQKVSIVSRGIALGFTLISPEKDRPHVTKEYLINQITVLMGGRVAEEIKFQQMTTGAANDIQVATEIAREMVVEYGMSSLGPLNFGPQIDIDQSKSFFTPQEVSPQTQAKIDEEIRKIVNSAYKEARSILQKHREKLDQLALQLAKKETLDQEDIKKIIQEQKPLQ
jgi:cell division protease FtsH